MIISAKDSGIGSESRSLQFRRGQLPLPTTPLRWFLVVGGL